MQQITSQQQFESFKADMDAKVAKADKDREEMQELANIAARDSKRLKSELKAAATTYVQALMKQSNLTVKDFDTGSKRGRKPGSKNKSKPA